MFGISALNKPRLQNGDNIFVVFLFFCAKIDTEFKKRTEGGL